MWVAIVGDQICPPRPDLVGRCPECQEPVIAKCGEIIEWHWAHVANTTCAGAMTADEAMWHRQWKSFVRPDSTEVTVTRNGETRRADIYQNGFTWELQSSPLEPEEIRARTRFWGNIRWLVDARDKFSEPDYSPQYQSWAVHRRTAWPTLPVYVEHAQLCLDLGDAVLWVSHINEAGTWASGSLEERNSFIQWVQTSAGGPAPAQNWINHIHPSEVFHGG